MLPEEQSLPPVDVSTLPEDSSQGAEERAFTREGEVLDRGLRKVAGFCALWFACFFYLAGLMAAMHFAGLGRLKFDGSWHIVTSVLIALFSVPTVLVLAVFRSTAVVKKDSDTDSMHAAVGTKFMQVLDKLIDKMIK